MSAWFLDSELSTCYIYTCHMFLLATYLPSMLVPNYCYLFSQFQC